MTQKEIKDKWLNGVILDGYYTFNKAVEAVEKLEGQRIPNDYDWKELVENTKFSFDKETKEGVFTFQDGTGFRLPAAGYRYSSTGASHDQGASGLYWLSSVPSASTSASLVYFSSAGKLGTNANNRAYGFSVRCVQDISGPINSIIVSDDNDKLVLDACCGSRMFWFDKQNPICLFMDKRYETLTAKDKDKIRTIDIKPDLVADFTDMPFDDNSFHLVVFDPPHMKTLGETSWMAKKYGKLPNNWHDVISKGFDECMRVLKPNGTLIFKWNEIEVKTSEILSIIPYKPLFGHTSGKQSKTIWMCFMKGI